jgi:hypothetical protein
VGFEALHKNARQVPGQNARIVDSILSEDGISFLKIRKGVSKKTG